MENSTMEINLANMVRVATIVHIVVTIVGAVGVTAGVVWVIVAIMQLLIEGLKLLVSTVTELDSLVGNTPVLHFLFVLAIFCAVVMASVWMVAITFKCVKLGVRYVA